MQQLSKATLRAVATFEGLKGLLVVLAGLGLLGLLHRDLQFFAEELVEILGLNIDGPFAQSIVALATRLEGLHPAAVIAAALLYAFIRFVEAYGLWNARAWAEGFAAASGAIYVPFEVQHLVHAGNTLLTLAAMAINVSIVAVMVRALWARRRTLSPG